MVAEGDVGVRGGREGVQGGEVGRDVLQRAEELPGPGRPLALRRARVLPPETRLARRTPPRGLPRQRLPRRRALPGGPPATPGSRRPPRQPTRRGRRVRPARERPRPCAERPRRPSDGSPFCGCPSGSCASCSTLRAQRAANATFARSGNFLRCSTVKSGSSMVHLGGYAGQRVTSVAPPAGGLDFSPRGTARHPRRRRRTPRSCGRWRTCRSAPR